MSCKYNEYCNKHYHYNVGNCAYKNKPEGCAAYKFYNSKFKRLKQEKLEEIEKL